MIFVCHLHCFDTAGWVSGTAFSACKHWVMRSYLDGNGLPRGRKMGVVVVVVVKNVEVSHTHPVTTLSVLFCHTLHTTHRHSGHTRVLGTLALKQKCAPRIISHKGTHTLQWRFCDATLQHDMRCYFNVRSKADMSQLNLRHRTNN